MLSDLSSSMSKFEVMFAPSCLKVLPNGGIAVAATPAVGQSGAVPATRIDWPAFLARHDLIWSRQPRRWGESAFIGNGTLGATVFTEGDTLGWTINRTDVVHDESRFPQAWWCGLPVQC